MGRVAVLNPKSIPKKIRNRNIWFPCPFIGCDKVFREPTYLRHHFKVEVISSLT